MKRLDGEVEKRTDGERDQQDLAGAAGRTLTGDQDVVDRRGFGERQLAVEIFDEVLPQRNDENHPEGAADETSEKNLPPGDIQLVDVHRRNDKGRTGGHDAGRLTDRLHHHVLEETADRLAHLSEEDRQNGDGNRCLDRVSGPQRHVCASCGEENHHGDPDSDGPQGDFRPKIVGGNDGRVDLTRFQFSVRVGGQQLRVHRLRFLHHSSIQDCGK